MLSNLSETLHSQTKSKNKQVAKIWSLELKKQKFGATIWLPEGLENTPLLNGKNVKQHFVSWQKNCLCLTSLDDQIFKSFRKPNPWINLIEINFYQFLLYFLQFKSFLPWMASFNSNINDLDFVPKDKSKLVKIVANWGHSQWKQLNLQKIE